MLKQIALILGLYVSSVFGQVNNEVYLTKRPELQQKFFSKSINENLSSYNYFELFQDENYISSTMFQKLIVDAGVYGTVSASQSREEGWNLEYCVGVAQELIYNDGFYAELYYSPFWFNKDGRIKDLKTIGTYMEFYPNEYISILGSIDFEIDKKIKFSSIYLTLEGSF